MTPLFAGERLGRKNTFMVGVTIMSVGAVLQTTAFSVSHMIFGRLITGEDPFYVAPFYSHNVLARYR